MRAPGTAVLTIALLVAAGCEPVDPLVRQTPVTILRETVGTGRPAAADDLVTISYQIRLPSGQIALSADQYRFQLGHQTVIEGMEDGVTGMRVGGRRVIEIPPHKHWGRAGYGDNNDIPPGATLTAHIRLLSME